MAKTRKAHDIQKGISSASENAGGDLDALHALEAAIAAKKAGWLEPDESALKVSRRTRSRTSIPYSLPLIPLTLYPHLLPLTLAPTPHAYPYPSPR